MTTWESALHARIAGAVKRLRGTRSAQWLADRTAQLGYPISRSAIANYESGRKKGLDVAELVVLAAALDTPPAALVYPPPYGSPTEVIPGVHVSSFLAAEWFSGLFRGEGFGTVDLAAWSSNTQPLRTARLRNMLEGHHADLEAQELMAQSQGRHPAYVQEIRTRRLEVKQQIDALTAESDDA